MGAKFFPIGPKNRKFLPLVPKKNSKFFPVGPKNRKLDPT
jgi:hypothetical protein